MTFLSLLLMSFLPVGLLPPPAENPCNLMIPRGGDQDWGEGAYLLPSSFEFDFYKEGEQTKFGSAKTDETFSLQLFDSEGKGIHLAAGDVDWIGHFGNELLKGKGGEKDELLQVLWHTFEGGVYVRKKELEKKGATFYRYREFFSQRKQIEADIGPLDWVNLGINLPKNCLNLRESPSIDAPKISCISGNDWDKEKHFHLQVMDLYGDWAKVEVRAYQYDAASDDAGEGCGFAEAGLEEGWVKAIDESGFPNIWFSVTNY